MESTVDAARYIHGAQSVLQFVPRRVDAKCCMHHNTQRVVLADDKGGND